MFNLKNFELLRMSISISVDSKWVTDRVRLKKNTSAECLGIIKPGGGHKARFDPDPAPRDVPRQDRGRRKRSGQTCKLLKELEGPRGGGGACFAGHGGIVPASQNHHSILVSFVNGYLEEVRGRPDWSCKLLNAMELCLLSENLTNIHSTCILRF